MKIIRTASVAVVTLSLAGCATSFTGNAHVENGRAGCEEKCRGQGMQIAGMVYMGEYSSACVCEVPRASGSSSHHEFLIGAAAGGSGAAAGVIMQMSRMEEQQRHMMVFR